MCAFEEEINFKKTTKKQTKVVNHRRPNKSRKPQKIRQKS
jgi:hypothetical protein